MRKDFWRCTVILLIFASLAFLSACSSSSSSDDPVASSSTTTTSSSETVSVTKVTGSATISNSSSSSKPGSYKSSNGWNVPTARMAASTSCTDYRIYFIPVNTGVKGDIYLSLGANATTGICDVSGDKPANGTYDVKIYSETTEGSGTFDVEEAVVQLGLVIDGTSTLQTDITFDESLKIVNASIIKITADGTRSEVQKTGNLDIAEIAAFPDITGTYTVKMKRTQMNNFQQGTDDAIEGDNNGGWEESYYIRQYEGNLRNPMTYSEIADTASKRLAVWIDKGKRDACYAVNSSSDTIATYSMQDDTSDTGSSVLTINSATTSDDIYTFLTANSWLPEALTEDLGDARTGKDEAENIDCSGMMTLLKPFYAGATVDADNGFCTTLLTPAQGVALTETQTYLATLTGANATMSEEMMTEIFAADGGPPHGEWCRDYNLIKGNTSEEAEFVNLMIGMCEMHTKGDDTLFMKRDMVRQFFDIFSEIKREPRSDMKMDGLANFVKDNSITSTNFAAKMGDSITVNGILDSGEDSTLLKTFLSLMAQMPCFDDGCKSWKRALKLAADNLTAFGDNSLCNSFVFSEDNFCFTYSEFVAQSTTLDLEVTTTTGSDSTMQVRQKNGSWGAWGIETSGSVTSDSFTMWDHEGNAQEITETKISFVLDGNTYSLRVPSDRDDEIHGEYVTSSDQYVGVFGNQVSSESPSDSQTVKVYRIKSGGGMAEQLDQMACSGDGYNPVELTSLGSNAQAILALDLPSFDFANGENTFITALGARDDIGDWYSALYDLANSSGEVAEGCGKSQLKDSIQSVYWGLQGPGVPTIVADPDEVTTDEKADVILILNNIASESVPAAVTAGISDAAIATAWTAIRNNLITGQGGGPGQLMNIFWSVQSIQNEVGYSRMKKLLATADMDPLTDGSQSLEELDATALAAFLTTFAGLDKQGHWSWIWGNEQASATRDSCHRPDLVANGDCVLWTAATLAVTGDRGESNLEEIKHRLREARRRFALEEDPVFRLKIGNIIANSQCIPDITFKDEPEIASDGSVKFKLNLRGPAFRLLDDAINFKVDDSGTDKYFVSDASMEIHQQDMSTTCVFGEKKELSNIPLPVATAGKYSFTGLFMRAFFDGCGESTNMQNSDSNSDSEQGSGTSDETVGEDRHREVQSFSATQD